MESKRCRKCGYWVAKGDKNCKNCGIIIPYNKEIAPIGNLLPHNFNLLEYFEDRIEDLVEPGASLMEVIPYLREVSSFAVGMFLLLIKTISGFGSKVLNALRFFLKEIPYKKL